MDVGRKTKRKKDGKCLDENTLLDRGGEGWELF